MRTLLKVSLTAAAVLALGLQAAAITITYRAPNAACHFVPTNVGAQGLWEFENPLTGNEYVFGHKVLNWRDADYMPGTPTPYDDWQVWPQGGRIDGCDSEIWMRDNTEPQQWIETGTQVASTIVSIHLPADDNDGLCQVTVDGKIVLKADMGCPFDTQERLIVIVSGLPNATHWIEVQCQGWGTYGCDVHCWGAAALQEKPIKWDQPPAMTDTGTIFYGWNQPSHYPYGNLAAADDWVCTTTDPVKDIHWWGSYLNWKESGPPAIQPDYFHLSIWTDVPEGGGTEPFSHPGQCIWTYDTAYVTPEFVGWDYDPMDKRIEACFKYNVDLPTGNWFYQSPDPPEGGIYWLCIQAVYQGSGVDYPWGWKTLPRDYESPAPDDGVAMYLSWLPQAFVDWWPGGHELWWDYKSWDLAFELTTTRVQQDIKWDQPPVWEPGGQYIFGWDEKSVRGSDQIVADDWMCTDMSPVSDVHWWGSYVGWEGTSAPANAPQSFFVSIWTDVPANPPLEPFSHPGTLKKQWQVSRGMTQETWAGTDWHPEHQWETCFGYTFTIPEADWFRQEAPNTIYWLSISAKYQTQPTQYPWGWKTREHFFQDDAVRIFSPTAPVSGSVWGNGQDIKDHAGNSWDCAFRITTQREVQVLKWHQPPVPYDGAKFNGWDELSHYSGPQIVGDDWQCMTDYPVTDVHWWGSFLGWSSEYVPQLPDRFHINIWDDIRAGITDPWSHPGICLRHIVVPRNEVRCLFAGWDIDPRNPMVAPEACFKFEVDLGPDQWFFQKRELNGHSIYWVTIAAEYDLIPENVFGWKTRPRDGESPAPDDAIRILDPTSPELGFPYVLGKPIEYPPGESWDATFQLTYTPVGALGFSDSGLILDHEWLQGGPRINEMLAMNVTVDPTENVVWQDITLQASGRGDDQNDVLVVDVWLDTGWVVGQYDGGDTWIGWGNYPADNGTTTITFTFPPTLLAGTTTPVLITYTLGAGASPGDTYQFRVIGATGIGQIYFGPVRIYGLPITSAKKVVGGLTPITIGEAKKLTPGLPFELTAKVLTADFRTTTGLIYIEEPTRASGIGIDASSLAPVLNLGDRIRVIGICYLLNGTELVVAPDLFQILALGDPLGSLGMNNKWTGGDRFGFQPGVSDDGVGRPPSYGLSNIGLLIRAWGILQGSGQINVGTSTYDVAWIDDGTGLLDGFSSNSGIAVVKPPDWVGDPPANGSYMGATGILRAIPNPSGAAVRLLVPRTASDVYTYYTPP